MFAYYYTDKDPYIPEKYPINTIGFYEKNMIQKIKKHNHGSDNN